MMAGLKIVALFTIIAITIHLSSTLRSNGANVCSRNVPYVQSYTKRYNKQVTTYRYESCWDWTQGFRCRVARISYRTAYKIAFRTVNQKQYYCCQGWSATGNECTKAICHSKCINGGKCLRPNYCECKTGYRGSICQNDINECLTDNGGCEQKCANLLGSFSCDCLPGYVLRGDGKTCSDHDECETSSHNCGQKCINTVGSFACSCNAGYELLADQITCRDIDDCESNPCHHLCSDKLNDYSCSCYYGYSLSVNNISCNPVCEQGCGNGGYCSTPGTCKCADGWKGTSCAIPQCLSCINGECVQPETCICETGWKGFDCSHDVDECLLDNGGCDEICTNLEGDYECSCQLGYLLSENRHSCSDHDECFTDSHNCQYCVNTKGSYMCTCPDGYYLVNETSCTDTNECDMDPCAQNCINDDGSFHCTCNSGYVLDANGRDCSDIDECALNKHGCSQICVNTNSWYKCACLDGYKLDEDGMTCTDINECLTEENDCQQECINVAGSYECVCYLGFLKTDKGCEAVCVPSCSDNGVCVEPNNCSCEEGWTGSWCEQDINECNLGTHKCEGSCTNVDGGYLCSCKVGFTLVHGYGCSDIDECANNSTNRCTQNCVNTVGSYYCTCEEGFTLDTNGFSCSDHDECMQESHGCDFCANTLGSFSCYCPEGYSLESDGKSCTPICKPSCNNEGVCASPGNCVCKKGWKGPGCNWEVTPNHWTVNTTGCQCYFDNSRRDCACCSYGGCQCASDNHNLCVQCGYGSICKARQNPTGIDGWTASERGCPCLNSNGDVDISRTDGCACCQNGGCSCGVINEKRCAQCGLPSACKLTKPWE